MPRSRRALDAAVGLARAPRARHGRARARVVLQALPGPARGCAPGCARPARPRARPARAAPMRALLRLAERRRRRDVEDRLHARGRDVGVLAARTRRAARAEGRSRAGGLPRHGRSTSGHSRALPCSLVNRRLRRVVEDAETELDGPAMGASTGGRTCCGVGCCLRACGSHRRWPDGRRKSPTIRIEVAGPSTPQAWSRPARSILPRLGPRSAARHHCGALRLQHERQRPGIGRRGRRRSGQVGSRPAR